MGAEYYPRKQTAINNKQADLEETAANLEENVSTGSKALAFFNKIKIQLIVVVAAVIMMVTRSVDAVLLVRMVTKMHNYEVFLSNIALALLFNCVMWPIAWVRMFITKQVTPKMRAFPKWKFLMLGTLDCIGNLLVVVPAAFVPGPVNVVMAQSMILVNMTLSFLLVRSRYNALHIGGLLVVIIGIALNIYPLFARGIHSNGLMYVWILILLLANIPMSMSNILKEIFLKQEDMDIWYIQAWCMFFQFLFGIVSFPVVLIPLPEPYTSIKITEIPANFWAGTKCFFGVNTLPDDMCGWFPVVVAVFVCFNLTFNYMMLIVFKYGSSTLALIAAAARIALSNIGFLIPFIAGEATSKRFTLFDILGLVTVIIGVLMYSVTKETKADPESDVFLRLLQRIFPRNIPCCENFLYKKTTKAKHVEEAEKSQEPSETTKILADADV